MKLPSPAHPISIARANGRVTVQAGGALVAQSDSALLMLEGGHDPVYYIPRKDVQMGQLARTSHSTYCSYKGGAAYYSIKTEAGEIENAVWTYEDPYPAVADIREHLAFYPSKVDAIDFSQR